MLSIDMKMPLKFCPSNLILRFDPSPYIVQYNQINPEVHVIIIPNPKRSKESS